MIADGLNVRITRRHNATELYLEYAIRLKGGHSEPLLEASGTGADYESLGGKQVMALYIVLTRMSSIYV